MAAWQAAPVRVSATPLPAAAMAALPANAPAPPTRAAESAATRAHPFAELLRKNRDEGVVHQQKVPFPPAEESSSYDLTDGPGNAPTPPRKAGPRMTAPTAPKVASGASSGGDTEQRVRDEKDAGAPPEASSSDAAAAGNARPDGWIAQPLAGSAAPIMTNERADGAPGRAAAADPGAALPCIQADLAATRSATPSGRSDARGSARLDANDARMEARTAASGDADPEARAQMLPAALAESMRASESTLHRPGAETRSDALAPTFAATLSSAIGEAPPAGAPPELSLPTPIDSADFGAAFGVEVSVLAKDGVQQAELHLNPAETGPVSIQIALDGSEARIDFGADLAATRAAIERSLPELAAALRDAGLTLTGGGVSQHAGGRASSDDQDGAPSTRANLHPSVVDRAQAVPPAARRVAAGGVDLYA